MYKALAALFFGLVWIGLPSDQVALTSTQNQQVVFVGTDQGLFSSHWSDSKLTKVRGFSVVTSLNYNQQSQALFVLHQSSKSAPQNSASISYDLGKTWETIEPSQTGYKNPDSSPVSSFGYFWVTDSNILVADIGYGRVLVKLPGGTWQSINLKTPTSSLVVVGDTLFVPFASNDNEAQVLGVDLSSQVTKTINLSGDFSPDGDIYLAGELGNNLLVGYDDGLLLYSPQEDKVIMSQTGRFGPRFFSSEGVVIYNEETGGYELRDNLLRLVGELDYDQSVLGYSSTKDCLLALSVSHLSCGNMLSQTLPTKLSSSEGAFTGIVEIPNLFASKQPDPALFVSGLGGGSLGDLYWEGEKPERVSLVTYSGLEFTLSYSIWTTGQRGYFLTFESYLISDICVVAEVVGRSIDYIRLRTGSQKVDLIGYSMGGLLSRCFVENLVIAYPYDNSIDDLLLIAVPNNGSFAAGLSGPFIGFADLFKGLQSSSLTPFSPQIKNLNSKPIPDHVSVTVVYGNGHWLPVVGENDGLVSYSDTRLEASVKQSVRYIVIEGAVHSKDFDVPLSEDYPILSDRVFLFDTIRLMAKSGK